MFYPCSFCPSDNVWRSRRADTPRCAHFSTVISPSWITEQISVGKCAHRGASAHQERHTSFKIVTRTKQTWTKHHNTQKDAGKIVHSTALILHGQRAKSLVLCTPLRYTLLRPLKSPRRWRNASSLARISQRFSKTLPLGREAGQRRHVGAAAAAINLVKGLGRFGDSSPTAEFKA